MQVKSGIIFVVSSPSGGGKSSLVARVLTDMNNHPIERVITYTTRQPRENEKRGVDYHFTSREEFLEKKTQNFFLETTEYDGTWYGSPRSMLDDIERGHSRLVITDLNGVHALHGVHPEAIAIWIQPPSLAVLEERLIKRGDSAAQVARRLALAQQEIHTHQHDTRRFRYLIVNDVFETAAEALRNVLLQEMGIST